jgi:hypothetical protein
MLFVILFLYIGIIIVYILSFLTSSKISYGNMLMAQENSSVMTGGFDLDNITTTLGFCSSKEN